MWLTLPSPLSDHWVSLEVWRMMSPLGPCRLLRSIPQYLLNPRSGDSPIDLLLGLWTLAITTVMGSARRQCWRVKLGVIWNWSESHDQSSWIQSVRSFLFALRVSRDTRGRTRSEVSEGIVSPSPQLASHSRTWSRNLSLCPTHREVSGASQRLASTASRYSQGSSRRPPLFCIDSCTFALSFGKRVLIQL